MERERKYYIVCISSMVKTVDMELEERILFTS